MQRLVEDDIFILYPTDRIVGTLGDVTNVRAAIEALSEAGFVRDHIDVFHGQDGLHRLDPTGALTLRGFPVRAAEPDGSHEREGCRGAWRRHEHR